jgi:hypothetical protein
VLGYDDDNLEYLRIELVDMGMTVKLRKYKIKQLATEYLGVGFFLLFLSCFCGFGLTVFYLVYNFLVASSFGQGQDELPCGTLFACARSQFYPLSP